MTPSPHQTPASAPAPVTKIDPARLLEVIARSAKTWLLAAVLCGAAAWVAAGHLPRTYRSSAQVLVQDSLAVNPFLEELKVEWSVKTRLPVIQTVLESRPTLERVLREMGEVDDSTPASELEAKVRDLRRQLEVIGLGGGLVKIRLKGSTPDFVHDGLQHLVDAFVDEMLRPQSEALEDATTFLEGQLSRVRGSLDELEGRIQTFKEDHAEELPEVFRVNLDTYLTSQKARVEAETELQAKQREKIELEARLRMHDPVARELEGELVKAESTLRELKSRYAASHPLVQAHTARLVRLREQLVQVRSERQDLDLSRLEAAARFAPALEMPTGEGLEATAATDDLMTGELLQYRALLGTVAGLESRVEGLRQHGEEALVLVRSFAAHERTLNGYLRDVKVKLKLYTSLLEKYEDARVTRELAMFDEKSQVWIIEEPGRPSRPHSPGRTVVTAGAFAGGLLLGLVWALLAEALSRRIRRDEEASLALGAPLLGSLPRMGPGDLAALTGDDSWAAIAASAAARRADRFRRFRRGDRR